MHEPFFIDIMHSAIYFSSLLAGIITENLKTFPPFKTKIIELAFCHQRIKKYIHQIILLLITELSFFAKYALLRKIPDSLYSVFKVQFF